MTVVLAICVGVLFAVSVYLMLGRELKGVAMGVFLIGHAANLSIIAMSRSPVRRNVDGELLQPKRPPLLGQGETAGSELATIVDPLPQALILTAIVIGFAVMGFLLTLLVQTGRVTGTLDVDELGKAGEPDEPTPEPPAAEEQAAEEEREAVLSA